MIGEMRGERPSDISVLEDSAPGEAEDFHPKKLVILLPGVLGPFVSIELVVKDLVSSSGRGGGPVMICVAIPTGRLSSFLCTLAA